MCDINFSFVVEICLHIIWNSQNCASTTALVGGVRVCTLSKSFELCIRFLFCFVFVVETSKLFCYTKDHIENGKPNEPMTTQPFYINKTSIELL